MAVGLFAGFGVVGPGPVRIRPGAGAGGAVVFALAIAQGVRQDVFDVAAEEKQIVEQRHDGQQPVEREERGDAQIQKHTQHRTAKVDPGHVFHFDRNEEKQQHPRLRRDGRHGEKQAEVQRRGVRPGAEEQRGQIGQQKPGEIIQIEAERAPVALEDLAELIVAEQRYAGQEQIHPGRIVQIRKDIRKQPPDLPAQNGGTAEAEIAVDDVAGVDAREHIDHQITDGDDEHEVRDALTPVFQAEALKPPAKIFHTIHPPDFVPHHTGRNRKNLPRKCKHFYAGRSIDGSSSG